MKHSVNLWRISNFVVGGARSECGPPVAVIWNTPQIRGVFQAFYGQGGIKIGSARGGYI
ncbi:hypothetical protein [Desulfocicer vacuolatum]|uniref:hypothetical protein n=1 Tax=Desulfocicer vacuolatum TaxID=2298 RepID=UPI001BAF1957|nr:hypothetical protein [Desulfocicer vacuolatum]